MCDEVRQMIAEKAAKIRAELTGANLFGEPLDWADQDSVLLASWINGYEEGYDAGVDISEWDGPR